MDAEKIKGIAYEAAYGYREHKSLPMLIKSLETIFPEVDLNTLRVAVYSIDAFVDVGIDSNGKVRPFKHTN